MEAAVTAGEEGRGIVGGGRGVQAGARGAVAAGAAGGVGGGGGWRRAAPREETDARETGLRKMREEISFLDAINASLMEGIRAKSTMDGIHVGVVDRRNPHLTIGPLPSLVPSYHRRHGISTEVDYLGQLHHKNLVKLIGYCSDGDNRLLVYEFMPKGSLENHLFRRGADPLSWAIRIKVAIRASRGLSFLHDAENQVIYRDFKASNILLDSTVTENAPFQIHR
eukprot:XP_020406235.1 serine/threonine-protein kinase PBL13-like [Zea mays]